MVSRGRTVDPVAIFAGKPSQWKRFAVRDTQAGNELTFDGHALESGGKQAPATVHDENFVALLRERGDLARERAHRGFVFEQCSCELDYDSH